jgi:very-short-patch-repair endonuclease
MFEIINAEIGECVKSTEFYDFLGIAKSHYSRFVKKHIIKSIYFDENKDYLCLMKSNAILGKKGQFRQELLLSASTAKKICMVLFNTNEKAKEVYSFLMNLQGVEVVPHYPKRKELLFEINLSELLEGITPIVKQYSVLNYRIDFYLPDLKIAIEYDELHHNSNLENDKKRQKEIQELLKCDFIRVNENFEISAINKIIKIVIDKCAKEFEFAGFLTTFGEKMLESINFKSYKEMEDEAWAKHFNSTLIKS